ncbi:MAG: DUF6682 family protein [Thermodesulfobacteriota bacterium]
MTFTVGDVKVRIERAFGDEANVQVTDDDMLRWINDGQREVVMQNEGLLEKISTANLVLNQDEYTMPADILVLRSVRVKLSSHPSYTSIQWQSLAQFEQSVSTWDGNPLTGLPACYTTYEGKLFLYPRPSENVTEGIKFLYSKIPTILTMNTEVLGLPVAYHNLILKYCLIKANEMDEDFNISTAMLSQFQQDIGINKEKEKWGAREFYPTVTVLTDDMG